MPLDNLHTLSNVEYARQLQALITQLEGRKDLPYFDTARGEAKITIGVGFNIDVPANLDKVMTAMAFSTPERAAIRSALSSASMMQIRAMPNGSAKDNALQTYLDGVLGRPFKMTDAAIAEAFPVFVEEHRVAVLPLIPTPSLEQMALVSLRYNSSKLVGNGLKEAS